MDFQKLKEFMSEYSEEMEERMRRRLEIEQLFGNFFTNCDKLDLADEYNSAAHIFKSATQEFPFVFFYSFMTSFRVNFKII